MPRQIVRVITPGTVGEELVLIAGEKNFLLAAVPDGDGFALAAIKLVADPPGTRHGVAVDAIDNAANKKIDIKITRRHPAHGSADPLNHNSSKDAAMTSLRQAMGRSR